MAVFCLAKVSLFCFALLLLRLFRRAQVTPPSPSPNFLLSEIASRVIYRISSLTLYYLRLGVAIVVTFLRPSELCDFIPLALNLRWRSCLIGVLVRIERDSLTFLHFF